MLRDRFAVQNGSKFGRITAARKRSDTNAKGQMVERERIAEMSGIKKKKKRKTVLTQFISLLGIIQYSFFFLI